MTSGKVYAHVGRKFTPTPYDVVVVGAGRMGSLCAHFLLQARPELRVLLLDQGGLPNEEGASIMAPGLWTEFDVPTDNEQWQEYAELTRALALGELSPEAGGLGIPGPNDTPTLVRGLIELLSTATPDSHPIRELSVALPLRLADLSQFVAYREDKRALTYSVAALTARGALSALAQGADLMLNAQAIPTSQGVRINRLSVTNTHQIVVHESHEVSAKAVVIAAGSEGPHLVEEHLGTVTHHSQAYRQLPRLNVLSSDATPIVRAYFAKTRLTLRPHVGGYTVIPPIHHRDPYGYQPTGGRLSGVPLGIRRETLKDLLLGMKSLPALSTEALDVGSSTSDIAGVWLAVPESGWPSHEALTERHYLLLGGEKADLVGAGVARAAAQAVVAQFWDTDLVGLAVSPSEFDLKEPEPIEVLVDTGVSAAEPQTTAVYPSVHDASVSDPEMAYPDFPIPQQPATQQPVTELLATQTQQADTNPDLSTSAIQSTSAELKA